jgi:hypothetical protein
MFLRGRCTPKPDYKAKRRLILTLTLTLPSNSPPILLSKEPQHSLGWISDPGPILTLNLTPPGSLIFTVPSQASHMPSPSGVGYVHMGLYDSTGTGKREGGRVILV